MIDGSFTTEINSTREIVWGLMLDRAEHPESFTPGIKKVEIRSRFPEGFDRETWYGERRLKEHITIDEGQHRISSEVQDHQHLKGDVSHRILPMTDGDGVIVATTLNYRLINGATESQFPNLRHGIQESLIDLKNRAEERAKGNMVDVENLRSKPRLGIPMTDDARPLT